MIRTDRFIAFAVCGLLAACDRGGEPAAPPPVEPVAPAVTARAVAYSCQSGATVAVQYSGAQTAVVTYEGQTYEVRAVEAASGARYSGSGIQWWTASRDGTESGTLGRLSATDGGVSAILERCSRPLPPPPGGVVVPAASAVPCRSADLRLSAAGGDAGMSNRVSTLAVQNVGVQPCSLTGYPTVAVLDGDGDVIDSVRSEQTIGNYFRAGSAPTPVVMPPQGRAWFDVAWNVAPDESAGQTTCPEAAAIRMTPPGDSAGVTLAQELTPCGGRVRVSPFRPSLEDQAPAAGAVTPTTSTPAALKAATPVVPQT